MTIRIAGLVPFTTIDFPGRLAAVLFLQGCPLRCPFCHNHALQSADAPALIDWAEAEAFLMSRKGRLDGVVLSGGEPLMQAEARSVMVRLKEMGFQIGVHTSGVCSDRLKETASLIDWVGLDVKAPWGKYETLCGRAGVAEAVRESLSFLMNAGLPFEARTTCDPRYLTVADIVELAEDLAMRGVKSYRLQRYRTFDGDVNPPEESSVQSFFRDEALQKKLKMLFPDFGTR